MFKYQNNEKIQTWVRKENMLNPYSNVIEIMIHENLTG